jgi:hypothetical protein
MLLRCKAEVSAVKVESKGRSLIPKRQGEAISRFSELVLGGM